MYNNDNNNSCKKFPGKTFFFGKTGFQLTFFENKRTFMKKAVLHITTLMHYKATKVLRNLFSTNQENG